jgi:metallo-beta-lactamase family protein
MMERYPPPLTFVKPLWCTAHMFLTFLGGVGTVTGSKTLVETEDGRFLVDCGLFQGPREIRERNWQPFPIAPERIDAVVLTHAHLDHVGYLPALVHDGFTGPVYCTPNTAELAAIIMRDSARLQEEDTTFARKKGFSRHAQPRPLYDSADAEQAITQLQPIEFGTPFTPIPNVTGRFDPGGHILGSSITTITDVRGRTTVFSGDLGRDVHPLLVEPMHPLNADAIVVESTYGDRQHEDLDAEIEEMAAAITRTVKRGGSVVIPAFAVDRTEVLIKTLRDLQDQHRIPLAPIHVDSPMALAALRVYRQAIANADPEIRSSAIAQGTDIIDLPNMHEATTPQESMALDRGGAQIIVSASGMGTGGRVVHHLKALLPDNDNTVILVGYQAVGTLGRALQDGATQVKVHGQYVKVRAEIVTVGAFSVHADADELIDWIRSADRLPSQVFINHGEPEASAALASRIAQTFDIVAVVPTPGERVAV